MLYGDERENLLAERIIGCGIAVRRALGPGMLESVYESALCLELEAAGIPFARQIGIPLYYRGTLISEHRPDLAVDDLIVVEIKSAERLNQVYTAQVLTYLRVRGLKLGLILNFNSAYLKDGLKRVRLD
jgi:GxxExxY protein